MEQVDWNTDGQEGVPRYVGRGEYHAESLDISVGKVNKSLKEIKKALEKMDEKESATPLRKVN